MIALDEDALICDLAETYGILNYRALPLKLVATLCCGLGPNSRIKQRQHGLKVPMDLFLFVKAVDLLNVIRWMFSKDGQERKNPPDLVHAKLIEHEEQYGQFATPDEFESFRARLTGEGES